MSQEKVREILSHVDMTKIDLSSFRLSEKKFDELSHLYRNRVILSCIGAVIHKDEFAGEEVDHAFALVQNVIDNPNIYSYANIYANERRAVDDAINDITTNRNRSINDIKLKAIEKRIKDVYKQMRKTIELALENGNAFEEEFDEAIVERCMRITKDAIESGRQRAAEAHIEANASMAKQTEQAQSTNDVKFAKVNVSAATDKQYEKTPKTKIGFWKRIFNKA